MTISAPPIAVVLLAVLDGIAILRAVTRSRGVELTLAWIFAILALPVVGAVAYLLVADPSIHGMTRRKRLTHEAVRGTLAHDLGGHSSSDSAATPLLHLAATVTDLSPTAGNRVILLAGDEHAFQHMEAALSAAKRSIWAEYYVIRNDQTGRRFLDLLVAKASQGVEVRLLYDALGSLGLDAKRLAALSRAGGRLSPFLRVNPLRRRWAVHLRNHRKLIVIDGEVGFTGGMNIGDEYSGRARRKKSPYFRDAHLAIRGPAVVDLSAIFVEDWRFATDEALPALARPVPSPDGDAVVAVVPSGPDQEHNASGLVYFAAITSAAHRCFLTSPYFVPDETLLRALMTAAMRGVDVRILVPERCDVALIRAVARSYYAPLIRSGVRIYEYQKSMLHAKTLAIDGRWTIVGSANADMRSFRLNFELGVLVVDEDFAKRMERRFEADATDSVGITPRWLSERTRLARAASSAARLLSPLL